MIKNSYNDVILPVLPDGSGDYFSCITYNSDYEKFFLFQTKFLFGVRQEYIRFHTDYEFRFYSCEINYAGWKQESVTTQPGYWWTISDIMQQSQLIWTGQDIVDLDKSTSSNIVYAHKGTEPVEVVAANPPYIYFSGWLENGQQHPSSQIQKIVLRQGRPLAGKMAVFAYNDDGGEIQFRWLMQKTGGSIVPITPAKAEQVITGAEEQGIYSFYSEVVPPNDEVGTYAIACFIDNYLNNSMTSNAFGINFEVVEDQNEFCQKSFSIGFAQGLNSKEAENGNS